MATKKPRETGADAGEPSGQPRPRWAQIDDREEVRLKLTAAGRDAIEEEATDRARAMEKTAGALSGVYEPGELERLREDWSE